DVPAEAKPGGDGTIAGRWNFVTKPDHPVKSGSRSVKGSSSGVTQQLFEGARPGLKVGEGDTLFAYVYIDPVDPPKEIMLQWHSRDWDHRAYWGENLIAWGSDETGERRHMGPLPKTGKWVRLEVDAA